jgi:hypothetical protein
MQTEPAKRPVKMPQPTVSTLVAALFTETKSAHGALADLASAGIPGDRIAVTFSAAGQQTQRQQFDSTHSGAADDCSLVWRLRHGFERDLHHHGAKRASEKNPLSMGSRVERPYCVVELHDTLRGIGVAEDRIQLLDRNLGMHGVLILVEAEDQTREVQSILEKNCGQIRTDSVTEREHTKPY